MDFNKTLESKPVTHSFICEWEDCGKVFKRKADFQRHYKIHTNERSFHCSIPDCGKSFVQKSALIVHIRTHTGEKPYQCEQIGCSKRFSDSSALARHRRVHKKKLSCAVECRRQKIYLDSNLLTHDDKIHLGGSNDIPDTGIPESAVASTSPIPTTTFWPWYPVISYPDMGHGHYRNTTVDCGASCDRLDSLTYVEDPASQVQLRWPIFQQPLYMANPCGAECFSDTPMSKGAAPGQRKATVPQDHNRAEAQRTHPLGQEELCVNRPTAFAHIAAPRPCYCAISYTSLDQCSYHGMLMDQNPSWGGLDSSIHVQGRPSQTQLCWRDFPADIECGQAPGL